LFIFDLLLFVRLVSKLQHRMHFNVGDVINIAQMILPIAQECYPSSKW